MTALAVLAAAGAVWMQNGSLEGAHWILPFAAITAGAFLLVLLTFGWMMDRNVRELCSVIDGLGTEDPQPAGALHRVRLFGGLNRSTSSAVDRCRQREVDIRAQLRELEIRHRVSEAERRQISAVLNSLRDSVVVTDNYMEVVMVNEAAGRLLDFNSEDAIHRPLTELLPDGRLSRLIADARESGNAFERRHVEHQMNVPLPQGGQETRAYDVTLACVENHRGEVGGVVAVLHDMTREREVSDMKSDFVSKASHELRTPLSSIRAYVEMLVDGEAEDEASRAEFYRIIQSETDRLSRLIDNMLNISRIEAGIIQVDRERVDLSQVITRATNTIEPQAREKNITITRRLSDVGLTVEGEPDMLYQVLLNLVSNAIKYTPDGGRVTVTADTDNLTRSAVITVSDTGLGIPPDSLPKLFDKFYRVENYKRVAKGTGLGLSLCRQIIERVHGGQIGVESKLGMGSKFWFSIPMRYAGSQTAA